MIMTPLRQPVPPLEEPMYPSRLYRDAQDRAQLQALSQRDADLLHDEFMYLNDVVLEYYFAKIDPVRHMRVWEDAQGNMRGCALLLGGQVDAVWRAYAVFRTDMESLDILEPMLAWAEAQTCAEAQRVCKHPVLRLRNDIAWTTRVQLACGHGYTDAHTYSIDMRRSLIEPVPAAPALDDVQIVDGASQRYSDAWLDLIQASFAYENEGDLFLTLPAAMASYDPSLDLGIVADGQLVAVCAGATDGIIGPIATASGLRRRGLARALLLETLRRMRAREMAHAYLGVLAENPFGANHLYASCGFAPIRTVGVWEKPLA